MEWQVSAWLDWPIKSNSPMSDIDRKFICAAKTDTVQICPIDRQDNSYRHGINRQVRARQSTLLQSQSKAHCPPRSTQTLLS